MPYFTRPVDPTTGSLLLIASVGVSAPRQAALKAAGHPIPPRVRVEALVDTGASCTCVDPSILAQLGLSPTGTVPILTPSTGGTSHAADQYDISLTITARDPSDSLVRDTIPVVAAELLSAQGFAVLLGRDILQTCLLVYDGIAGTFSFSY